ncbi:hypothetical protein PG997_015290 [Apiospora hydei]|uniref:Uncharacterized protein n=1 Tax=Apiospora hydei TaxID=1337664 RepID=A0ABR1UTD1_9PEZI
MKFPSTLLPVAGLLHGAAAGLTGLALRGEHQPDSQTMAAYEKVGLCMYYYNKDMQPNWQKGMEPCSKYCQNNGVHGYSECDYTSYMNTNFEEPTTFPTYEDDDGFPWVPAPCKCENKVVEYLTGEIVEFVAEGLEKLGNILCAVFVSAIKEIADVGLMFVPGGASIKGAGQVIQYAKSAYENGMSAADFYNDWVGQACGVPDWSFNLEDMFTNLVDAPDSLMGEKEDEERKKKEDEEEEKKKKEEKEKQSCKVKRAPEPYVPPPKRKVNKFDEEERRTTEECIGGKDQDVVHITRTHSDIGYYIQERKDIPKIVCRKEHTQACYHYRSVMSRYSNTKDMTEWTCQQTATSHAKGWGNDGTATNSWGVTALVAMPGSRAKMRGQHWFPWANGFIYHERAMENGQQKLGADKKPVWKGCERDEFPPRYFWPGDDKAPKHMRQLVRLLPDDQNKGAGQLWNGFCNDNNAASTRKYQQNADTYVVSAHLKSVKGEEEQEVEKGTTTSITTVTVSTLRAIFSISEFEGLKPEPYDGLEENQCYPRDLIDDPGWALLTDDEWYKSEGLQHAPRTADYRRSPTKAQVDAAKARIAADTNRKGKLEALDDISLVELTKKFTLKDEAKLWKKLVGNGDGQIPIELWGVLPSLPPFPKPAGVTRKKRHGVSLDDVDVASPHNGTLALEDRDTNADLDGDDHEVDLDSLTDEELEQWLAQYEEVARRMYVLAEEEELTPTSPPVVEAQATMAAVKGEEGLLRGEPAAVGSEVTNGLPLPTGM